jgi:HK97 family phage major capsid protein
MTSKELRQKRAALIAKMHDLLEGDFTAEVRAKWERMDADQKALQVQISSIEATESLSAEMRSFVPPPQRQPGADFLTRTGGAAGEYERRMRKIDRHFDKRNSEEYSDAWEDYARFGRSSPLLEELRAATPLTEAEPGAGYLIPVGFQKELEIKLKAIGPIRGQCRVITTSTGNTLNWPTWDDTGNVGEWLSINSDATTGANPTFGQVVFGANVASSKQVLVPVQLLQDSAFDLQSELSEAFAIRLSRVTNTGYTTGNGSGQPNGIAYAGNIPAANVVKNTGDTQSNQTDLNSIGVNDLANLISALDPAYRQNAKYMANQSTFDAMRKLKDSLGRPLWVSSITQGEPDRIFGYPFFYNQMMSAVGAGNTPLIFGDFAKYVIRDVLGITFVRFNELYMGNYQVGFQAYLRTDGQVLQPAAFASLYVPQS